MTEMDLEHHAADKVQRALKDVLQLTDDPGHKMRIALMASSVCIGSAAGSLSGKAKRAGFDVSMTDATLQILELLKLNVTDGADAVMAKLQTR